MSEIDDATTRTRQALAMRDAGYDVTSVAIFWNDIEGLLAEIARLRAELAEAHQRIERYEQASVENDAGWRAYREKDAEEIARLRNILSEKDTQVTQYRDESLALRAMYGLRPQLESEIARLKEDGKQWAAKVAEATRAAKAEILKLAGICQEKHEEIAQLRPIVVELDRLLNLGSSGPDVWRQLRNAARAALAFRSSDQTT